VACRVGTADGAATTDVAVTVAVSDADWGVATDKCCTWEVQEKEKIMKRQTNPAFILDIISLPFFVSDHSYYMEVEQKFNGYCSLLCISFREDILSLSF